MTRNIDALTFVGKVFGEHKDKRVTFINAPFLSRLLSVITAFLFIFSMKGAATRRHACVVEQHLLAWQYLATTFVMQPFIHHVGFQNFCNKQSEGRSPTNFGM